MPTTDEILKKYSKKIESEINSENSNYKNYSRDYLQFKEDMLPDLSRYKKLSDSLGKLIKIKLSQKEESKIQHQLDISHLDIKAPQSAGLALVAMLLTLFIVLTTIT